MASAAELAIKIIAEDRAAKVLKDLDKQVNTTAKRFTDFGKQATDVGRKMSIGLTAPLAAIGALSIDAASDMAESMSKMQVVFGEASGSIEEFTTSAARNLGMSRQAATEAAGTFGNLFTAMGMGKQPAADMSTGVIQLAADLASFNNIKPEEALEKLRAGLVGESEPLRALGVNINAATVEAKAMAMGLADANGEISDAAKVQARYALILEQTTNAQGDFARTSDGLANSTRIAKAQMADLQAEIGEKLLPIALKAVNLISGLMNAFSNLSPEVQTAAIVIGGVLAVAGPLAGAVGLVSGAIGALIPLLPVVGAAIAAIGWPITLIVAGLATLALAWSQNWGDIQGKTKAAVEAISGWITDLIGAIQAALKWIADLLAAASSIAGSLVNPSAEVQAGINAYQGVPAYGRPAYASGGIVSGPIGAPQLAIVHGGEHITPVGGGGGGIYITVQGSVITDRDLEDVVVRGYTMAQERGRL